MAKKYGGIWVICDDLDSRVDHALQDEGRTLAIHLDAASIASKSSCLALISRTPATIDYIAVATTGRRSGGLERRVVLGPALHFMDPLGIEDILAGIPSRLQRHIGPPSRRVRSVPPASWEALLDQVKMHEEVETEQVDNLVRLVEAKAKSMTQSLPEVLSFERDAAVVALEVFGGAQARKEYLENLSVDSRAPFIKALENSGARVLEDRMIENDSSIFPGAEVLARHVVGAVEFQSNTGSLTIVNANRTGIEKTLGVDLVYYHHVFQSFTMVQYKRLIGSPEEVYRPYADKSYSKEIARMMEFRSTRSVEVPSDVWAYRLDSNEFYFKLCASTQKGFWSRMIPGMYIPLALWELFVDSSQARGPRGGVAIGYENTHRRFNNSDFARLLRGGWIGSFGDNSQRLGSIMEAELSADKSLMVAVHRDHRSREDYLRDPRGRFASAMEPDSL